MKRVLACLAAVVVTLLMVTLRTSDAQTLTNPSKIQFSSADHATVTDYDIGYFASGATDPVQVINVPKSEFTAAGSLWERALPRPVLGNYTVKVRAYGLDASTANPTDKVVSVWSGPSNSFLLSPREPAGVQTLP
jgi:hypothetical protein